MHRTEQAIENRRLPKTEVDSELNAPRDAPGIHAVAGQTGTFYLTRNLQFIIHYFKFPNPPKADWGSVEPFHSLKIWL